MKYEKYIDYTLGLEFYVSEELDIKDYLLKNFLFYDKLFNGGIIDISEIKKHPLYYKRKTFYTDISKNDVFVITNIYFDNINLDYKTYINNISDIDYKTYKKANTNYNFIISNSVNAYEFDNMKIKLEDIYKVLEKNPYNKAINIDTVTVDFKIPTINCYIYYYIIVHGVFLNVYQLIRLYITKYFKFGIDGKIYNVNNETFYDKNTKLRHDSITLEYLNSRINKTYSPILKELQLFFLFKNSKYFDKVIYSSEYDYNGADIVLEKYGKLLYIALSDGSKNSDAFLDKKNEKHTKKDNGTWLNLKTFSVENNKKNYYGYWLFDQNKVLKQVLSKFNDIKD